MPRSLTTEDFIKAAIKIHGTKFDYSSVVYIASNKKVTIICPYHGKFEQLPNNHTGAGTGCKKCTFNHPTVVQFYLLAQKKFKDRFDYSQAIYKNYTTPIFIICPTHGKFEQSPVKHLTSRYGCAQCAKAAGRHTSGATNYTTKKWIALATKVHGDKYNYARVVYTGAHEKVTIICKDHNEFQQSANSHLAGRGCKQCANAAKRIDKSI